MFKKIFALSDKGSKDLNKAIISVVIADLSLMLPVFLFMPILIEFLNPILGMGEMNLNFPLYIILSIIVFLVIYFTQKYDYRKTYLAAYEESANRRITLAEKIRKLPLSFFGQKDLTEFTNTMMDDATFLENIFSHAVPQLFGSVICIFIITIGLMIFDWRLALGVLAALPLSLILLYACKKLQKKHLNTHIDRKIEVADTVQETLDGIRVIKSYNRTEEYFGKVDNKLSRLVDAAIKVELLMGSFIISAQSVLRLGIPIVVLLGIDFLTAGTINILYYLLFLIVVSRIYDPLTVSMTRAGEVFALMTQIDRMKAMENHPIMTGEKNIELNDYNIKLDDVSFGYNEEEVIKDDTIAVNQGEVTALVGPSGSGKSTLSKLIARFWDVDDGKITIGGKNISKIDPETLLSNFAIVFQDVILFNDTVYNNIKIGKKDASEEEVLKAARLANCDDFIKDMPNGYDTEIGENGWTLSGGERQRISIARALLKDAPIILLDEATASLDVENETKIQTALSRLIKNKTLLIIAHRMRTVKGADKIVVLEEGKIIEQGSHDELIKNKNLYSKLVKLQNESLAWNI